jgi:hypothetical protein
MNIIRNREHQNHLLEKVNFHHNFQDLVHLRLYHLLNFDLMVHYNLHDHRHYLVREFLEGMEKERALLVHLLNLLRFLCLFLVMVLYHCLHHHRQVLLLRH